MFFSMPAPLSRTAAPLALCLLAAPAFAQEQMTPPPLTPVPEAPVARPPVPQRRASMRVHLEAAVPDAELYDVSSATRLCRAPCGVWLDTEPGQQFQVVVPGVKSSPFALDDLSGDVAVKFTPRDEELFTLGRGFTIAGAVLAGIGYLSGVAWLVIEMVANLFLASLSALFGPSPGSSSGWLGAFELLYVAAGGLALGVPMMAYGIPTWIKARERLDVGPSEELKTLPAPVR
jgi:hypothetical protein